jgi:ubiquinone/menaquinone biosynthesis C-methylase UbiE
VSAALPNRASAAARARRRWSAALGADPREHALLAVAEHRPRRVLDVGSGDGEFAEWCARRLTAEMVAVDQSAWLANPRASGIGALPYEEGAFDVVAANEVLPGVGELDGVLADLVRLLRPGGRLVALTASERYLEPLLAPHAFPFSAAEVLARHFARVERREVVGEAVFPTRAAVRGFLADLDEAAAVDVETLPEPFRATVRVAVFVAETAA